MVALPPGQTRMECDGTSEKSRSEPESAAILGARINRLGLSTDANLKISVGVIDCQQYSVI